MREPESPADNRLKHSLGILILKLHLPLLQPTLHQPHRLPRPLEICIEVSIAACLSNDSLLLLLVVEGVHIQTHMSSPYCASFKTLTTSVNVLIKALWGPWHFNSKTKMIAKKKIGGGESGALKGSEIDRGGGGCSGVVAVASHMLFWWHYGRNVGGVSGEGKSAWLGWLRITFLHHAPSASLPSQFLKSSSVPDAPPLSLPYYRLFP
ncbi:hypothetical protein PIB30_034968 [Stylosanthes scabra]|uniref:Uncharacterized protein n=1 Tax=Stylosanthes scabra TaxID=79078 RepID=A0ABU6ZAI7_9FABA|nr:hypothetical protein [Stylosanthes scabra]